MINGEKIKKRMNRKNKKDVIENIPEIEKRREVKRKKKQKIDNKEVDTETTQDTNKRQENINTRGSYPLLLVEQDYDEPWTLETK